MKIVNPATEEVIADIAEDNGHSVLKTFEMLATEGPTREKIVYEPLGIIANISAWNYPYLVGVNVFVPALIGGNGVLYKPSEYATLTGLQLDRLLHLAGVPENCFQTILGSGEAGNYLLELP